MAFRPLGIEDVLITISDSLWVDAASAKLLPEDVSLKEDGGTTTWQEATLASSLYFLHSL